MYVAFRTMVAAAAAGLVLAAATAAWAATPQANAPPRLPHKVQLPKIAKPKICKSYITRTFVGPNGVSYTAKKCRY
jgi:hypothetical protein